MAGFAELFDFTQDDINIQLRLYDRAVIGGGFTPDEEPIGFE